MLLDGKSLKNNIQTLLDTFLLILDPPSPLTPLVLLCN
jgi:hypothetical protein